MVRQTVREALRDAMAEEMRRDADIFLTRWNSYALYRNRSDGTFEDATDSAGLGWPSVTAGETKLFNTQYNTV